ncbi:MAG TPA: hypothetical protein VFZ02_10075 [Ktedonobacteraceae bacterium]
MTHSIFSPDSDAANSSDGHNSSKLDYVQTNNHGTEITMPDGSTNERMYALPLSQGFALSTMSIAELADQCMNEINHYHRGVFLSERYFAELLFRAILQGDLDAWKTVQLCLSETVRGWLDGHPKREEACRLDSEENYITQAFARFHQAAVLQQVEYSRLPSAFQYLRVSLNSALLDALRASSRPLATLLPKRKLCNSDMSTTGSEVWEMLEKMPLDNREQRLAFLLFNCGLRPKDIVHTFPEESYNVHEISLLRCTIIERLLDQVDQHNWPIDTNET